MSHAKIFFSKQEILDLLDLARVTNAELGVTGLLLYDDSGMFIQVIEGEKKVIFDLFAKIKQDPRHYKVVELWSSSLQKRNFPDWKMGFRTINSDTFSQIPGYSNYLNEKDGNKFEINDAQFTKVLLQHFKRNIN
jgi:hypothetical protein